VLTAAHVINEVLRDPVQYDLEVTMAMDGNKNLGSAVRSGRPYVPALYDPNEIGSDYDYALITLSHPLGQSKPSELKGDKLCFWGSPDCGAGTVLVRVDPKSLITQVAYSAGFPKNKGTGAMWCFSGVLAVVDEKRRTMVYTAEITEGQSGSPVWIRHDGKSVLVGIAVSRSTDARRFVVRVTRELCRQLTAWMGPQQHEKLGELEEALLEAEGDHSFAESVFEVVPSELADLEEHQVAPQGLVLLDHMQTPKTPDATRPGTFTTGTLAKLTTLNPLFIDAADNVVTDTSPTGLQTCLNKLITSKYDGLLGARGQTAPGPHDHVHVAIVDLTGNKLTAPEFAGWGATSDIGGASVPKILGLYGAFQLRSDLRELATRTSPADGKQLESSAVAEWRAKGLASQLPDLAWLFDIQKWTPTATIDFTTAARTSIRHIVDTCHAGTLISKVSLPYIGSLTWQSGLFHPTRSGLWLKGSYCDKGDWNSPVSVPNVHNATALSAATYFTLLAQGRLVDQASSTEIATALGHGCVTSLFPRLPVVASKCGILHGLIHDCAWIQSRSVRYVIAVLSKLETATQKRLYPQLCADLDVLIQKNNQTPKSPCVP